MQAQLPEFMPARLSGKNERWINPKLRSPLFRHSYDRWSHFEVRYGNDRVLMEMGAAYDPKRMSLTVKWAAGKKLAGG